MTKNYETLKKQDQQLLFDLHQAVLQERKLTLAVIELLKEVEDRKLYLNLGFASLVEFCIKELKYSESAAYRRISAMRLVRDLPEVERKIEDGSLSLAVISQAAVHIRQKEKWAQRKLQTGEKKTLLDQLEGLSCRETEKLLIQNEPQIVEMKESIRQVSGELQELKLVMPPEMQNDLEKLKMLLSHVMPGA